MSFVIETICLLLNVFRCLLKTWFRWIFPRKKKDIRGEIVLVTGAGHGIGRELALRFGRCGAIVVLWDINKTGNDATADEIKATGGSARAYLCDVSKVDDVRRTAQHVRQDVGDVTILCNNAGVLNGLELLKLTDAQIKKCMDVNTMAHFWTIREFLPHMVEINHGHIVTVCSVSGNTGGGTCYLVDYCASKYAVNGLIEGLAEEMRCFGKDGVYTTTVFPFFVQTGLTWYMHSRFTPVSEPSDVAEAVIDGVLRNKEYIYYPRQFATGAMFSGCLPRRAVNLIKDFSGIGISPHNDASDKCKKNIH